MKRQRNDDTPGNKRNGSRPRRGRRMEGNALGSRAKAFLCPEEGALQIDGFVCGFVRGHALIAARSLVGDSCTKVLGCPFRARGGVGVLTEGVALVYYGAARWAGHSSLLNTRSNASARQTMPRDDSPPSNHGSGFIFCGPGLPSPVVICYIAASRDSRAQTNGHS